MEGIIAEPKHNSNRAQACPSFIRGVEQNSNTEIFCFICAGCRDVITQIAIPEAIVICEADEFFKVIDAIARILSSKVPFNLEENFPRPSGTSASILSSRQ